MDDRGGSDGQEYRALVARRVEAADSLMQRERELEQTADGLALELADVEHPLRVASVRLDARFRLAAVARDTAYRAHQLAVAAAESYQMDVVERRLRLDEATADGERHLTLAQVRQLLASHADELLGAIQVELQRLTADARRTLLEGGPSQSRSAC